MRRNRIVKCFKYILNLIYNQFLKSIIFWFLRFHFLTFTRYVHFLAARALKKPPCALSSLNPPDSKSFPDSSTKILSQPSMVLILCAIVMVVLPSIAFLRAPYTFFWESSSKADVASSKIRMAGSLIIVLAMATLCF